MADSCIGYQLMAYVMLHVTGKTMLMDLFYANCMIDASKKQRLHFHQFMLNIHEAVHRFKQGLLKQYGRDVHLNMSSERDALVSVAVELASRTRVLCLDEFQVTDICDAMILDKFFQNLWKHGVVLIATSNRPPADLYQDGLNRSYFLPFIQRLQAECIVKDMRSQHDYRIDMISSSPSSSYTLPYFTPIGDESTAKLRDLFVKECQDSNVERYSVKVMMGRTWIVDKASIQHKICWLEFDKVCRSERGAADYRALCQHFNTIYLHNIPILNKLQHDTARRFITFIDEVYDSKRRLLWTADAPPASIFQDLKAENGQSSELQELKQVNSQVPIYARGDNTSTNIHRGKLSYSAFISQS
jgi:predicted ATPase